MFPSPNLALLVKETNEELTLKNVFYFPAFTETLRKWGCNSITFAQFCRAYLILPRDIRMAYGCCSRAEAVE